MAKLTITKRPEQAKANNTTVRESFTVSPGRLVQRPPFDGLYPIDPEVLARITVHMKSNGYDHGQPITVWRHELENGEEERAIVDGNTRLQAARAAGLLEVTVVYRSFASDQEALEYAIHNQRDRRNLTDSAIFRAVEALDAPVTGFKGSPLAQRRAIEKNPGKTANVTAKKIGTTARKVETIRAVKKNPRLAAEVKAGKKSINRAYREIKGTRLPQPMQALGIVVESRPRTWRKQSRPFRSSRTPSAGGS